MKNYLSTNYDLNNSEIVSVIDELPLWSAPFGLQLLQKINYRKHITALDIGTGTGFPLLEVAMRLGQTSKLYGIDPWKAAVKRVRSKIKNYGINNVELINGVAEEIPLPGNSVDLIFSNNGLNNVADINKTLNECRRISKPGAQFVFTYNTDKTMHEFYSVMEDILIEQKMTAELGEMKKHIGQKRKPVDEYIGLLKKYDYNIADICQHKFDYRFVDGTTMLNHFLIKLAFIESWKNIIPESDYGQIFSAIEERLNAASDKDSLLRLTIPFVVVNAKRN